jgi:hypothetical protein
MDLGLKRNQPSCMGENPQGKSFLVLELVSRQNSLPQM